MPHTQYLPLTESLERFSRLSPAFKQRAFQWINRCDGFLLDMEFIDEDITVKYLIDKLTPLLSGLPDDCSPEMFCQILAQEFEGLYFHSVGTDVSGQKTYWNSLKEDYQSFKNMSQTRVINYHLDRPHASPEDVVQWMNTELP